MLFIFTSTNKVYGDRPNELPFIELESRYELPNTHPFYRGIDESMSIDNSKHSVFGASKVAADIMVQEYGKYFGLATGVFRGGCLTGPSHSGTKLHGFLAYLVRCIKRGEEYTIIGYKEGSREDSKGRGEEDKGEIKFNSLTKKSPRGDFLYLTEVRFYQNFI
jgi:CDP-paratose 2-epimerase